MISDNRAGLGDSELTLEEIIANYKVQDYIDKKYGHLLS